MARARVPRSKDEDVKPEIVRPIRLGDNGDVYGRGEEEEFLDALKSHFEDANANLAEGQKEHSIDDELKRLHTLGYLVNFDGVEFDEEERTGGNQDERATRRALVEPNAVETTRERTPRSDRKARTQKAPVVDEEEADGSDQPG